MYYENKICFIFLINNITLMASHYEKHCIIMLPLTSLKTEKYSEKSAFF